MKSALITGITGQDGSYLAELLLEKGYSVTGIVREGSDASNIEGIKSKLKLVEGKVTDADLMRKLISEGPNEFYNLASVTTVAGSWESPIEVSTVGGLVPLYILDAIHRTSPETRFFQASSAEMYGATTESPQSEKTLFQPKNPYGASKLFAHHMVENYRTLGVFAVSGILFNHESPRRPEIFVTRKITSTLARIAHGSNETLTLGNMNAKRDWSYAGDICNGMWMSLQEPKADTYVFASGETHSVREFVEAAAKALGMVITWEGYGEKEMGRDATGRVVVKVDPAFFRPIETHVRQGNIAKATAIMGWKPKVTFEELVGMMVEEDVKKLKA